jgi:nucleoside-triphosphatase THEP1
MDADSPLPAAAIALDGQTDVDALLAEVVRAQQAAGRRVRGLLMRHEGPMAGDTSCAERMVMIDIATQDEYLVSQAMGSLSRACRADPQGFARASVVLRRAAQDGPDLVVCNRFGKLEAEGGGFTAELLTLMADGVPVLTAVSPAHQAAWAHFSGGAPLLEPTAPAVRAWLGSVQGY